MSQANTHTETSRKTPPGTPGEQIATQLESAFGESETGVRNDAYKESKRTKGLWIFDNILFNLTNLSVFALSVYATYKTNFSQAHDTPKELQNWWMKRGNEFTGLMKKTGMSEEKARAANMVLWSFVDGSVAAPFVAALKQKRNPIARKIDTSLGTLPDDPEVYHNQPKETWATVLKGRLAAFSIVMPTYFVLSAKGNKSDPASTLNHVLFDKPAQAIVEQDVLGIPGALKKRFPKLHVEGLVKTAVFEAFYTTLCTSILFLESFHIARRDLRKHPHLAHAANDIPASKHTEMQPVQLSDSWKEKMNPVNAASHIEKITSQRNNTRQSSPAF